MIGYAAHLRIYEPVGSLPEDDRTRWTAYLDRSELPSRPVLMAREHEVAVAAVARLTPRLVEPGGDDVAYVRHLDGLNYVCPWRLRERSWAAVEQFRSGLPDIVADAFVPPDLADLVAAESSAASLQPGSDRVPIRSCGWQVPVTWFTLFESDERRLVLGDRRAGSGAGSGGLDRALVYLTAMSRARRRVARALHVVERTVEGPAAELIEELARWLEEFHPHALVELDYGGLVHLLDDESLAADDSVGDVAAALEALSRGDAAAAGEHYERVTTRWRDIASFEHVN